MFICGPGLKNFEPILELGDTQETDSEQTGHRNIGALVEMLT